MSIPKRAVAMMAGLAFAASLSSATWAAVSVQGTRLVYPASEREITVRLSNDGQVPALMQVWIDRGDIQAQPQDADAPFVVTPPIFRLDPAKGQSVRVAFSGENLPADRESLFWFNALEIPPMPEASERSYMQIAVRSRLKLFYRPPALAGSAAAAARAVRWQVLEQGGKRVLRGDNPSPYHVSFASLGLRQGGRSHDLGPGMIEPFARGDFALPAGVRPDGLVLEYRWMSDYGVANEERVEVP
ncbi:chaperone protein EcpD [Pseudomonas delhiensis]|uniref:Chaperone protein EcpD n=1 Tax=Pseudomonas delhiensis TaxID=366289 RepID=A0A239I2T4_9PSED|nr:fimbria/pilus periplasmic chaperone [Pseudomonas delhiensis]SDI42378.1 chaperone protein EcpD [Pseudomonas delhiensis]SNS86674.1 chaperone protein EcpD [Pseudomonas delhiensis]